jgi:hypothetical protein
MGFWFWGLSCASPRPPLSKHPAFIFVVLLVRCIIHCLFFPTFRSRGAILVRNQSATKKDPLDVWNCWQPEAARKCGLWRHASARRKHVHVHCPTFKWHSICQPKRHVKWFVLSVNYEVWLRDEQPDENAVQALLRSYQLFALPLRTLYTYGRTLSNSIFNNYFWHILNSDWCSQGAFNTRIWILHT